MFTQMIFLPVKTALKAKLITTGACHVLASSSFLKNCQAARTLLARRWKVSSNARLTFIDVVELSTIVAKMLLT